MEATERDEFRMHSLLNRAYSVLRDAEQVAAGKLVRVSLYWNGEERARQSLIPPRVAAYLLSKMGEPPLPTEAQIGVEFFDSKSTSGVLPLAVANLRGFMEPYMAWTAADTRRTKRRVARLRKQNDLDLGLEEGGVLA